jgi:hypothetical protein
VICLNTCILLLRQRHSQRLCDPSIHLSIHDRPTNGNGNDASRCLLCLFCLLAKKEATRIYLPLLAVTNLIYGALLLGGDNNGLFGTTTMNYWGIVGAIVTWIEQAYSYVGILEHSATNAGSSKKKSKDLAGGSSIDLLAVTILVQFGSVLHSTRWLWLTVVGVPVVGAYKLYQAVYGGSDSDTANKNKSSTSSSGTNDETDGDDAMAAKRQRRAEKRRQKRG